LGRSRTGASRIRRQPARRRAQRRRRRTSRRPPVSSGATHGPAARSKR
jgi:hypothetical protein